jgi:hypothetical protein
MAAVNVLSAPSGPLHSGATPPTQPLQAEPAWPVSAASGKVVWRYRRSWHTVIGLAKEVRQRGAVPVVRLRDMDPVFAESIRRPRLLAHYWARRTGAAVGSHRHVRCALLHGDGASARDRHSGSPWVRISAERHWHRARTPFSDHNSVRRGWRRMEKFATIIPVTAS